MGGKCWVPAPLFVPTSPTHRLAPPLSLACPLAGPRLLQHLLRTRQPVPAQAQRAHRGAGPHSRAGGRGARGGAGGARAAGAATRAAAVARHAGRRTRLQLRQAENLIAAQPRLFCCGMESLVSALPHNLSCNSLLTCEGEVAAGGEVGQAGATGSSVRGGLAGRLTASSVVFQFFVVQAVSHNNNNVAGESHTLSRPVAAAVLRQLSGQ